MTSGSRTLESLVPLYLRSLAIRHRSADTIDSHSKYVRSFLRFLASQGVTEIDQLGKDAVRAYPEVLATWVTTAGTLLKTRTQAVRLHGVMGFLRWLAREDYVATDLSRVIALPKLDDPLPKAVLEPAELDRLVRAIDVTRPAGYRDRAIVEVLYSTAIRRHELVGLQVTDIDFDGGYLYVRRGKGGRDRVVPIGAVARAWVQGYLVDVRPGLARATASPTALPTPSPNASPASPPAASPSALFLNRWGQPLSRWAVGELMRVYRRRARLRTRVTPHGLRATCTTEMLRAGASERILQEMLGHKSLQTLTPYTRLTINDLRAAHARFHPRERLPEDEA